LANDMRNTWGEDLAKPPGHHSLPAVSAVAGGRGDLFAGGFDAGEEGGGGFVGAAFLAGEFGFGGNKFAAEGFGEDRLGKFVGAFSCGFDACFDFVGEFEEGFDAADDFFFYQLIPFYFAAIVHWTYAAVVGRSLASGSWKRALARKSLCIDGGVGKLCAFRPPTNLWQR
jgi:hypothetical protein